MKIDDILGSGLTSQVSREKLKEELKKLGIKNTEVINLVSSMPRHLFIDSALSNKAYENVSLPIGFKQTHSRDEFNEECFRDRYRIWISNSDSLNVV